jgi:hypothetical protein
MRAARVCDYLDPIERHMIVRGVRQKEFLAGLTADSGVRLLYDSTLVQCIV